jgi:translation initiation factor IF-2
LISKKLLGRTDNAVKNFWNSRLKKRIGEMEDALKEHLEKKRKEKILSLLFPKKVIEASKCSTHQED